MIFFFYSCDPAYRAFIVNDTPNDILIELQFDSLELKKYWGDKSYIPYLNGAVREGGTLISFDTIALNAAIKLGNNQDFEIEGGIVSRPDFKLLQKIIIFTPDTISLYNKDKMFNAFTKIKSRKLELRLK